MKTHPALLCAPAGAALLLLLTSLLPLEDLIGHDYYLAFTEYLIGMNHLLVNGPSLPHFTASLCGGLPFFADPQSTFVSLPQLLVLFLSPHAAVLVTYFLFYVLGYAGAWALCRKHFGHPIFTSHLAALFFILNGFCFAHFFVGHVTHHVFLMSPWFVFLAFPSAAATPLRRAALSSLLLAYAVYSGGMHVLALWVALALLFLPAWLAQRDWWFLGFSILFLLLLVPGKLVAGYFFLKNAYPMPLHVSGENPLLILFRYFFFIPSNTPSHVAFGQLAFGPWEYVGYVSKLSLPAAGYFFYDRFRKKNRIRTLTLQILLGFILLMVATGSWQPELLSGYHNPIKWLAVFILPLTLAFAYSVRVVEENLRRHFPPRTVLVAFGFLSALLLWENTYSIDFFTVHKSGISFDSRQANEVWAQLRERHALPPVRNINTNKGWDITGLFRGETSLRCAEPTYGYFQEGLHTRLRIGPTAHVSSSAFNLSHPGCLLYPSFYGCRAWDRIPSAQATAFDKFIHAKAQAWDLPTWQTALFALHGFSAVALGVLCLVPIATRIGRTRQKT
ncbi:MAG: hypothetical protein KDD51_04735 [Bdellovibrionales bacterium]|nr:hypothetical protein [Bdellovibrionales bacterium]